ncbi:MAG TPA: ferritin family protein [Casimicrobiaceae bacterium]|nr:ferritin family protein [Casimicrobiaceae bacterium]
MPATLDDFMAQAIAMEHEAALRYEELADTMETHNNVEVAQLFRRMAAIERKHAAELMSQMGWSAAPVAPGTIWERDGGEGPESVASDSVHYLMQPYHALQLALANEQRAVQFFADLAVSTDGVVRHAARTLEAEEREHVALVKEWLARVPKPAEDWAEDPDPPRYTD